MVGRVIFGIYIFERVETVCMYVGEPYLPGQYLGSQYLGDKI